MLGHCQVLINIGQSGKATLLKDLHVPCLEPHGAHLAEPFVAWTEGLQQCVQSAQVCLGGCHVSCEALGDGLLA